MSDYERGRREGYGIGQVVGLVLGVLTMGITMIILEWLGG